MESEKKSAGSKRRKIVSDAEKESDIKENPLIAAGDAKNSTPFETGLSEKVKPARKTKTAQKKASLAAERIAQKTKTETNETAQFSGATEIKSPRKRKTTAKENISVAKEITAKEKNAKSLKVNSAKVNSAVKEITADGEIAEKILPQGESSAGSKIDSSRETGSAKITENAKAEEIQTPEVEEKSFAEEERSPVFKELAAPQLPDLQPENRAWLQMQSPTRVFFYWSLKTNPFETLQKVFGGKNGDYTLCVKVQNLSSGAEDIYPIASYGSAWFDVESDSEYRAEVGFFAANRPFIRLLFSNSLDTPRLKPSPHFDRSPEFAVTPIEFAAVLDGSGYKQDAFETALTADNIEASNEATFNAFEQLTGAAEFEINGSDLRLLLFGLASGLTLEDLRGRISPNLFAYVEKLLRENAARLSTEKILGALEENFGLGNSDAEDEAEEITYSVFGASRINFQKFPKQFWKKLTLPGSSNFPGSSR